MILIIASLLPPAALMLYIYLKDRFQREPAWQLVKAFLYGILTALVVVGALAPFDTDSPGPLGRAFLVAALPEEGFKLLFLHRLLRRNRHFDEPFDGIVYAAFVSMGFAALENVLYVAGGGLGVAAARALLAVPAHFMFAVAMGYYYALARFAPGGRARHAALCLLVPFALHGIYDWLLMQSGVSDGAVVGMLLLLAFVVFDIAMWVFALRRIRRLFATKPVCPGCGAFAVPGAELCWRCGSRPATTDLNDL